MTRYALAKTHRPVLQQFAWSNVLLAFDFDGTLAPIVTDPERAEMRATTRRLLERLSQRYPCVVISGRSKADVAKRTGGAGVLEVVGNHGLEPSGGAESFEREVRGWLPTLERHLWGLQGVVVEDKRFSVAVHYRKSRHKGQVLEAIRAAAAALGRVRLVGGKQVVNILPEGAPHKGVALERLLGRLDCDTAIYVGDDETDEDVFALGRPGVLGIRVSRKLGSLAHYYLRNQAEVDVLLWILLGFRSKLRIGRSATR